MVYPYFITYMVAGFAVSLIVFWWALHNGQFKEQQRARFLPLEDEAASSEPMGSKIGRYELYALFGLALAGLGASAAVLVYALFF